MKDQLDDSNTKYFERRSVLKHCWFSDAKVRREVKLSIKSRRNCRRSPRKSADDGNAKQCGWQRSLPMLLVKTTPKSETAGVFFNWSTVDL